MAKLTEYADLRLDATQLATFSITRADGKHIGNVTQEVDSCRADIELQEDVDVAGLFHGTKTIEGRIEAPGLKTLLEHVKTFLDSQADDWQGGREQVLYLSATRSEDWWKGFYEGLHDPQFKFTREKMHQDGNHAVFQSLRLGKPTPRQEQEDEEVSGPATMTITYTPPGGKPTTSTLEWNPETQKFLRGDMDA